MKAILNRFTLSAAQLTIVWSVILLFLITATIAVLGLFKKITIPDNYMDLFVTAFIMKTAAAVLSAFGSITVNKIRSARRFNVQIAGHSIETVQRDGKSENILRIVGTSFSPKNNKDCLVDISLNGQKLEKNQAGSLIMNSNGAWKLSVPTTKDVDGGLIDLEIQMINRNGKVLSKDAYSFTLNP